MINFEERRGRMTIHKVHQNWKHWKNRPMLFKFIFVSSMNMLEAWKETMILLKILKIHTKQKNRSILFFIAVSRSILK